mgnify:CR=1 FL=1
MNFYSFSVKRLRRIIKKNFKEAESKKGINNLPSHLLWMLDQIEVMDDTLKASRWIGYILARLEAERMITNKESREIVSQDVLKNGT